MGDINENRNNSMGMNETESPAVQSVPTYNSMGSMNKKPRKAGKVLLWILIILLVLAGGVAAGYFYGQHQKNQEVEKAKQDAQAAAQAEIEKAREEAKNATPEKTVTDATCNVDELSLALEPADAAAGTYTYNVIFTNTGNRNCTLYGYPGISLVNDNGNMIGSPAERTKNSQEITITLEPQGKVKSVLYAANSDNFSDGQCAEGATKLRVYPPNDTGYLSVPTVETLMSWCPGFEVSPVMDV
jgi:Tfp pilus assembly protein PilX